MFIKVWEKVYPVNYKTTKIVIYDNHYIMVGGDDIYDLGFGYEEIEKYGIELLCEEITIKLGK